jgi:hypothetical protein
MWALFGLPWCALCGLCSIKTSDTLWVINVIYLIILLRTFSACNKRHALRATKTTDVEWARPSQPCRVYGAWMNSGRAPAYARQGRAAIRQSGAAGASCWTCTASCVHLVCGSSVALGQAHLRFVIDNYFVDHSIVVCLVHLVVVCGNIAGAFAYIGATVRPQCSGWTAERIGDVLDWHLVSGRRDGQADVRPELPGRCVMQCSIQLGLCSGPFVYAACVALSVGICVHGLHGVLCGSCCCFHNQLARYR